MVQALNIAVRYQAIVFARPSARSTVGRKSNIDRALRVSASLLLWPTGHAFSKTTSKWLFVSFRINWTKSLIVISDVLPTFIGSALGYFSVAHMSPRTASVT